MLAARRMRVMQTLPQDVVILSLRSSLSKASPLFFLLRTK
jgi:hypothetical protein